MKVLALISSTKIWKFWFWKDWPKWHYWQKSQGNIHQTIRYAEIALKARWICGYVCRGRQGEIERIHPPPTSSKNRL